ncbi:MAG TPA: DUF1592 domain-containing protein [Verrucomicrobiales bacterium]|nr:DUF1592 domain-containing protein [Verrucomicrobiales bacterium]
MNNPIALESKKKNHHTSKNPEPRFFENKVNCKLPYGIARWAWVILLVPATLIVYGEEDASSSDTKAITFISKYCLDCHSPPKPKAKLDLSRFKTLKSISAEPMHWDRILQILRDGEMPPDDHELLPSPEEQEEFIFRIEETLLESACGDGISPGPAMLRRLNKSEYSASIRDLLDIHFEAGQALPSDGAGGEGFDNAAETLFISPIHAEKYLDAARTALQYAFADTRSHKRFLIARPTDSTSPEEAANRILKEFLPRAFRRPTTHQEIGQYLDLFNLVYIQDPSFIEAMKLTFEAVLVSPNFLFIAEVPNPEPEPRLLEDHELAVRLSYFLWGTGPDKELMRMADQHRLNEYQTLTTQVLRMLDKKNAAKTRNFSQNFVEQWLGTRALGREFKPDQSMKEYDSELEGGMKYEPVFFFNEILAEDRSLLDLLDSDYTYVNRRLARHYGIEGEFREQPKRVELKPESRRGGLLGMSSVLAVSSLPHRTSPVLRGKWILETLLGDPPPPPPPNVPELEESEDPDTPQTLREKLEKHRLNPTCASCHDRIDPLGFGLENYDVLGRWRDEQAGKPIDARGTLPGGMTFNGPNELKEMLLERKDQFVRHLTRKMLGYALARGLTNEDYCTVNRIVEDLKENDYHSHKLVLGIVHSVPFRYKAGRNTDGLESSVKSEFENLDDD